MEGRAQPIGFAQDHLVQRLEFQTDLGPEWVLKLDIRYPDGEDFEAAEFQREGTMAWVDLTRTILRCAGRYVCQVRGLNGDKVGHSDIFYLSVAGAINATDPAPGYPTWKGDHTALAGRNQPDQHPIESVSGLAEALATLGEVSIQLRAHEENQSAHAYLVVDGNNEEG